MAVEDDVPALVEQSFTWCSNVNASMQGANRRLDGLSALLDGLGSRLEAVAQEGETTVATVERSFDELDALLDRLQSSLTSAMGTTGERVQAAQSQSSNSMASLSGASRTVMVNNSNIVQENKALQEQQQSDTEALKGQLVNLLSQLRAATDETVQHVGHTRGSVDSRHKELQAAVRQMSSGFTTFNQGVQKHSGSLQEALKGATKLSAAQLQTLQTDLQKQLDNAMEQVRQRLEENARGFHGNADQVETFLNGILSFLEKSRNTMDNTMRPPLDMVGNISAALQPIVNLLGLLQEVGLI